MINPTRAASALESPVSPASEEADQELANPFLPMPRSMLSSIRALAALYVLVVCTVALFNATNHGVSMAWIAISDAWLLFWIFWPVIFYKPTYGWCHPLILLALLAFAKMLPKSTVLLMYGLPDHVMLSDWDSAQLNMLFAYGNFVNSIALIAIYVGFSIGPRLPLPRLQTALHPPKRLYGVLLFFFMISIVGLWRYMQHYGGAYSYLKSLAFGMSAKIELAENVEGIGQYAVLIKMASVVAVIWVCAWPSAFRNPLFWVLAAAALAMGYLSEGKRSHMIYPAVLIMLCWMVRNRKVPYLRLAFIGVAAFLLVGLLGIFRKSNWSDTHTLNLDALHQTSLSEMATVSQQELLKRSGTDSTYFAILAQVPGKVDLLWGKSYWEWGLRFIPREWWPDKPRGVDVQANRTFYGADWGLPPGAVGEAYWNFHLPGVVLVFFLFGMCKRWLADLFFRYPDAPGVMAFYMISLFYFDPSQNGFQAWLYAVVPALVMIRLGGLVKLASACPVLAPDDGASQVPSGSA